MRTRGRIGIACGTHDPEQHIVVALFPIPLGGILGDTARFPIAEDIPNGAEVELDEFGLAWVHHRLARIDRPKDRTPRYGIAYARAVCVCGAVAQVEDTDGSGDMARIWIGGHRENPALVPAEIGYLLLGEG